MDNSHLAPGGAGNAAFGQCVQSPFGSELGWAVREVFLGGPFFGGTRQPLWTRAPGGLCPCSPSGSESPARERGEWPCRGHSRPAK